MGAMGIRQERPLAMGAMGILRDGLERPLAMGAMGGGIRHREPTAVPPSPIAAIAARLTNGRSRRYRRKFARDGANGR